MQYVMAPVVLCILVILQPYVLGEESNDVEKKSVVEREASLSEEEADKRGWTDLNVWGKRNWQKLPSSVWGKRGWQDLNSAWGKRNWDRLSGAWGKRGNDWTRLAAPWGKRADWKDLRLWGKRDDEGWTKLRMWGKRFDNSDRGDYVNNGESLLSKDDLNEYPGEK